MTDERPTSPTSPNPLSRSFPLKDIPLSIDRSLPVERYYVAGIIAHVWGVSEIPKDCTSITCLWLLHPRNGEKDNMQKFATRLLNDWLDRRPSDSTKGVIAVSYDQRNHGTRNVHQLANESWRDGNETHAQDMFSVFHGTAVDLGILMDHLPSYIFHGPDAPLIEEHLAVGVSLGGHAVWQAFFNEPRVTGVVVIIGCPDYAHVMKDRARLSKRKSYLSSKEGNEFFGSKDFPKALVASVHKWDPKGQLFGASEVPPSPSEAEQNRLRTHLNSKIKNKRILLCSGGADKLVPYRCGEPFITFLKDATTGWYKDGNVYVEDIVYPGVGHACPPKMVDDTSRFILDILKSSSAVASKSSPKI